MENLIPGRLIGKPPDSESGKWRFDSFPGNCALPDGAVAARKVLTLVTVVRNHLRE